jgi:hypothetical protein
MVERHRMLLPLLNNNNVDHAAIARAVAQQWKNRFFHASDVIEAPRV